VSLGDDGSFTYADGGGDSGAESTAAG